MVALRGTVRVRGVLTGTVSPSMTLPRYSGPYDVTPAADAQVLATKGLAMASDVTVAGMGEVIEKAGRDAMRSIVDGSFKGIYRDEELTQVRSGAFRGCTALTSVELPAAISIGSNAFQDCTALTSVELPAAISIGSNSFQGCTGLTSVELPAATSVGSSDFQGCTGLTSADLPCLRTVGWTMFQGCSSLKVVDFGTDSIGPASLGSNCFQQCTALDTMILRRATSVVPMGALTTFTGTPIANGGGYIYVPRALVEKYKVATNWSVYADQFRAIEDYPDICDPD